MADLIERCGVLAAIDEEIDFRDDPKYPDDKFVNVGLKIAKKLINKQHAVNRWIPVEDALPEIKTHHISDTVLCYCDSGALAVARLEENAFGQVGFNCEKDDSYHYAVGKVLYWMPIPEIPEPPESEGMNEKNNAY